MKGYLTKESRISAISEERAFIEVKDKAGKHITIGVCPGCFNNPERRKEILYKLRKNGLTVVSKADRLDGKYIKNSTHSSFCPYK